MGEPSFASRMSTAMARFLSNSFWMPPGPSNMPSKLGIGRLICSPNCCSLASTASGRLTTANPSAFSGSSLRKSSSARSCPVAPPRTRRLNKQTREKTRRPQAFPRGAGSPARRARRGGKSANWFPARHMEDLPLLRSQSAKSVPAAPRRRMDSARIIEGCTPAGKQQVDRTAPPRVAVDTNLDKTGQYWTLFRLSGCRAGTCFPLARPAGDMR